ncbi:hypothetical protein KSP39_PZI011471 [Platanthera zijinensis]|uniref:Uncharacterized protein n=1 Tax=Platanthera zijinensis TaxID=2320716 RepID=A0AAP0BG19_9ASPA
MGHERGADCHHSSSPIRWAAPPDTAGIRRSLRRGYSQVSRQRAQARFRDLSVEIDSQWHCIHNLKNLEGVNRPTTQIFEKILQNLISNLMSRTDDDKGKKAAKSIGVEISQFTQHHTAKKR